MKTHFEDKVTFSCLSQFLIILSFWQKYLNIMFIAFLQNRIVYSVLIYLKDITTLFRYQIIYIELLLLFQGIMW